MKSKRKGFTLVELLIVIVVIGILAAMMMLSSTEAVSSAKATKIIADMRNIRTAVLAWYTDNYDKVVKVGNEYKIYLNRDKTGTPRYIGDYLDEGGGAGKAEILKYLDGGLSIELNPHNKVTSWNKGTGTYFLCSETVGEVSTVQNDEGEWVSSRSGIKLTGNSWFVGYRFGKNEDAIKEKIALRAGSLGLLGGQQKVVNSIYTPAHGDFVYMLIANLD
ncbi:MAG: type II secretion system protein [Synergistaceae bacterium]|nr:type II secretion system protein [Synergistaceae bacterium]